MHAAWSWGVSSRPSLPVKQVVRHRRCVFAVGQVVEKGMYIFALGQKVVGIVAIGQLAMGLVSVGQAGIGLFFSAVSSAHTPSCGHATSLDGFLDRHYLPLCGRLLGGGCACSTWWA